MHPFKSPNPDDGCRLLASGTMSAGDAEILAEVLDGMPYGAKPLPPCPCPINTWDVD